MQIVEVLTQSKLVVLYSMEDRKLKPTAAKALGWLSTLLHKWLLQQKPDVNPSLRVSAVSCKQNPTWFYIYNIAACGDSSSRNERSPPFGGRAHVRLLRKQFRGKDFSDVHADVPRGTVHCLSGSFK
jgi:hypothetical protein